MRAAIAMICAALALAWTPLALGQALPKPVEQRVTIPADLTEDQVDSLLARLTDANIRSLLRDELARRAAARDAPGEDMTLEQIETRLTEMAQTINTRVTSWADRIANIQKRGPVIEKRLALASDGVIGMIAAIALLMALGVLVALVVAILTRRWRTWLKTPARPSYWDRVVRTLALGVLELLPLAAFFGATSVTFALLRTQLGPLHTVPLGPTNAFSFVWVFEAGILYSWAFIIFIRRAFAPDAPAIRIAPLNDDLAARLHQIMATAVRIGAAGWLIGGVILHIGLGFPPVMVTRALAGTLVAFWLLIGLARNWAEIQAATAAVFAANRTPEPSATEADAGESDSAAADSQATGGDGDKRPDTRAGVRSTLGRIVTTSAPWMLAAYIIVAWGYWLAHWLETGADRLAGPAGTLVVYLALPIIDRMGREIIGTCIRHQTAMAERFRNVLYGAWRLVIGVVAAFEIAWLWGLDLLSLAKGADAPVWASTAFDVAITLMIGWLIWRLIRAALHSEKRVSDAAEDVDPSTVPSASRLDTLVPLFRNFLLVTLSIVIIMMVLASMGMDIGPLIASAGIIGIAIGFGAQSLVRDIFSGIFFLVDDAFRVGEYIELDADIRGEVEAISIRSLQLRHHRGPVITMPFGELKQITNHNRDWVIYKMSFRMEPETDPQVFKKVVKEIGKEFMAHPDHGPKFIEPLKSQGVYYVDDDSALVMRVKFKCKPRAQFVLRREIYHRLRAVFEEKGLILARRKVEVVGPDGEPVPEAKGAAAQEAANAQAASAAAE